MRFVSSSHYVSAAPSSSGGELPTLFLCSSMRSLPQETVLHELFRHESFPQFAVFHELLQHRPLPQDAILQERNLTGSAFSSFVQTGNLLPRQEIPRTKSFPGSVVWM